MYGGGKYLLKKNCTHQNVVLHLGPGACGTPTFTATERPELTPELQRYLHVLGPTPKRCLETLADLGLSDDEIGRYFRMPSNIVTELRDIWRIGGNT